MLRRWAAVLFLVLSAPASADAVSEELVREFIRASDASADWSTAAAAVRSEGPDTLIEGLAFERQQPAVRVEVGRVRLRDLAARSGGGFSASEIEINGARLVSADLEITAGAAGAKAVSLASLPALHFDPRKVLTFTAQLYSALAESELGELAIPEIVVTEREAATEESDATSSTATYRNIRVTDMRNGVVARSSAGPVTVTVQGGSRGARFEIASAEVERADFGAIAHVLDERQYSGGAGDGIWRPALARVRYSGLTGSGDDGTTFRLDEIAIENAEARQPRRPFTSRLERQRDTAGDDPAEARLALETFSDVAAAFRVGAVRVNGVAIQTAPAQNASMTLDGVSLQGWSGAGLDTFEMHNLRFSSPQGFASMDGMDLSGLVFPDSASFLDILGLKLEEADKATRDAAIRKALNGLPRLDRFSLTGLSAGMNEATKISLRSLAVDLDRYVGPFPASAKLAINDVAVPASLLRLDRRSAEILDGLGISDLVLGITAGEEWDATAGRVDTSLAIHAKELGDVDLGYTYAGVTEDWLLSAITAAALSPGESDTEAVLKVLDGLGLQAATLRITDRSLLDRAFGFAARKQNLTVEGPAYRQQMRGALPFLLSAALQPDLAKLLTAPLQAFLEGGQTLVAEARPVAAIPLPALSETIERDPMSLPSLLNLTFRSEPATPRP